MIINGHGATTDHEGLRATILKSVEGSIGGLIEGTEYGIRLEMYQSFYYNAPCLKKPLYVMSKISGSE